MPAPIFTPLGDDKDDYITVDGHIDWAIIPAHTVPRQKVDMPIRVRVGDQSFGIKHILDGHLAWLEKMRRTPCELIWEKLSLSSGAFYPGNKGNRVAIYVRLSPGCFLVLESQIDTNTNEKFYSVVSMYHRAPKKDEKPIGNYESRFSNPNANRALRRC